MIRQLCSYVFGLVSVAGVLILSACTGTTTLPPISPTSPQVSTLTARPSSTWTPQPTLPATVVLPSPTAISTRRPTATPLLDTATPSRTPVPTLDTKQQAQLVTDILKTNGGCKLPCWWGIVPGSTRFQAAVDSLQQQGLNPYLVRDLTGALTIDIPHSTQLFDYGFSMGFTADQGVISRLKVDGETYNLTRSRRFANDWRRYSLSNVLQEYGQPSTIRFVSGPPAEQNAPVLYTLTLLYEPLGFAIGYTGPAQFDSKSNVIHACPRFEQMTDIRLILVAPGNPITTSDAELTDLGPTLQETTGVGVGDFYQKFKNSASIDCLEYHLTTP